MTTCFGLRDIHQAIITKIQKNFCNDVLENSKNFL